MKYATGFVLTLALLSLSGCAVVTTTADVAGTAVTTAVDATTTVVSSTVDMVTPDDDSDAKKKK